MAKTDHPLANLLEKSKPDNNQLSRKFLPQEKTNSKHDECQEEMMNENNFVSVDVK